MARNYVKHPGVWAVLLAVVLGVIMWWVAPSEPMLGVPRDLRFEHMLERSPDLERLLTRDENAQILQQLATAPPPARKLISTLTDAWVIFGFAAQGLFFMRFFLQWIASERLKRSHVPVSFWWFSLCGGVMLFTYAVQRKDPVFIAGQGLGCLIYVRNLMLIHGEDGKRGAGGQGDKAEVS